MANCLPVIILMLYLYGRRHLGRPCSNTPGQCNRTLGRSSAEQYSSVRIQGVLAVHLRMPRRSSFIIYSYVQFGQKIVEDANQGGCRQMGCSWHQGDPDCKKWFAWRPQMFLNCLQPFRARNAFDRGKYYCGGERTLNLLCKHLTTLKTSQDVHHNVGKAGLLSR